MRRTVALLTASLTVAGCGSDSETTQPPVEPPTCGAAELELSDGSCIPVGVPPTACAEGFEPADGGCNPILPPAPCPPGLMAIPGDTECREVGPCGEGTWGDIPIEPGTVFVDGSYGGGDSDGSEARPFTTVTEAVGAAPDGGMVAIAAGSYVGQVYLSFGAKRLWGRCPALVELVAQPGDDAAVFVHDHADGSEIHMLATRGEAAGVVIAGSTGLWVDRLWSHHTSGEGLEIGPTTSWPGGGTVTGSLIEDTTLTTVSVFGATAQVEECHIRGTAGTTPTGPRGINVELLEGFDTTLSVRRSHIEASHETGIFVAACPATIEGSVIRRVATNHSQGSASGVACQDYLDQGGSLTLRQSVVEDVADNGVLLGGSEGLIEHSVVRPGEGGAVATDGYGIVVQLGTDLTGRSNATIVASLIEEARNTGLHVGASDAHVDQLLVRDTSPGPDGTRGWGLAIARLLDAPGSSTGTILRSRIERSHDSGLVVLGSEATIDEVLVRDTLRGLVNDHGRALSVTLDHLAGVPSSATLTAVTIDRSEGIGILVTGSDATIARARVSAIGAGGEDEFGDGVATLSYGIPASTHLADSRIEDCARAAVSAFGATVSVGDTTIDCNPIALDGELYQNTDFTFEDLGGNRCGCGDEEVTCHVVSSNLTAPDPLVDGP